MAATTRFSTPRATEQAGAIGDGSAQLQRVAGIEDKVLRNALVTHCYHELSLRLRTALRRDDANWATFATWTSRAAGNFIRGDRIPPLVHSILQSPQRGEGTQVKSPPTLPKRKAGLLSGRVLESVSDIIIEANWSVFRELAPILEAFSLWVGGLTRPDDAGLARFSARLDSSPSRLGGQDLLVHALRGYHGARFERDRSKSAQRILHANILIAWHEQLRLRPKVALLLDAPVADVLHVTDVVAGLRLRETWRYLVLRTMLTSYVPEGRRLPPGPRARRCFADCPLPSDALECEFDPLDSFMATTRERERELAHVFADLRDRMKQTARWYWENQHTEALFRAPFVGRKHARLTALVQEGSGPLAAPSAHVSARPFGGPRLSGRDKWKLPSNRQPWAAVHAPDPVLQAALAASAPRVVNSSPPRDRRAG